MKRHLPDPEWANEPDDETLVIDNDEASSRMDSSLDNEIWGLELDKTRNVREHIPRGIGRGESLNRLPGSQNPERGKGSRGKRGAVNSLPESRSPLKHNVERGTGRPPLAKRGKEASSLPKSLEGSSQLDSQLHGIAGSLRGHPRGKGRGRGVLPRSRSPPEQNFDRGKGRPSRGRGSQRGREAFNSLPRSRSPPEDNFERDGGRPPRGRGRGREVVNRLPRSRSPMEQNFERGKGRGRGSQRGREAFNSLPRSRSPPEDNFERDGGRPPRGRGRGREVVNRLPRSRSPTEQNFERGKGRGRGSKRGKEAFKSLPRSRSPPEHTFEHDGGRPSRGRGRGREAPNIFPTSRSPSEHNFEQDRGQRGRGASRIRQGNFERGRGNRGGHQTERGGFGQHGTSGRGGFSSPPLQERDISPGRMRIYSLPYDSHTSPERFGGPSPPMNDWERNNGMYGPNNDREQSPGRLRMYGPPEEERRSSPGRRSGPAMQNRLRSPSFDERYPSPGRTMHGPSMDNRGRSSERRRFNTPPAHMMHQNPDEWRQSPERRRRMSPPMHGRGSPDGKGPLSRERRMNSPAVYSRGPSPGTTRMYGTYVDDRGPNPDKMSLAASSREPSSERMRTGHPRVHERGRSPDRKMYDPIVDERLQSGRARMNSPSEHDRGARPRQRRLNSPPMRGRPERPRSRSPENPRLYQREDGSQMLSPTWPQNFPPAHSLKPEHNRGQNPGWRSLESSHAHGRQEIPMDISSSQSPEDRKSYLDNNDPQMWRSSPKQPEPDQRQFENEQWSPSKYSRPRSPRPTSTDDQFRKKSRSPEFWPNNPRSRSPTRRLSDHNSRQRSSAAQQNYREETNPQSQLSNQSAGNQLINNAQLQIPSRLEGAVVDGYPAWNAPMILPVPQFPALGAVNFAGGVVPAVSQGWLHNTWTENVFSDPVLPFNSHLNQQVVGIPPPAPTWTGFGADPNKEGSSVYSDSNWNELQGTELVSSNARTGDGKVPEKILRGNFNWSAQPFPRGAHSPPRFRNFAVPGEYDNQRNTPGDSDKANVREPIVFCSQSHPENRITKQVCYEISTEVCAAAFFNQQVRMYKNVRKTRMVLWWCADQFTEDWVARQVGLSNHVKDCAYKIVKLSEIIGGGDMLIDSSHNFYQNKHSHLEPTASIATTKDITSYSHSLDRITKEIGDPNYTEPIVLSSKFHPEGMLDNRLCNAITSELSMASRLIELEFKTHWQPGLIIWWCKDQCTINWIVQQVTSSLTMKCKPYKIQKWCEVTGDRKDLVNDDSPRDVSYNSKWNNQLSVGLAPPNPLPFPVYMDQDVRREMGKNRDASKKRQPIALCSKFHPKFKFSDQFCVQMSLEISDAAFSNPRVQVRKSYRKPGLVIWCCADDFTKEWIAEQVASSELTKDAPFMIVRLDNVPVKAGKGARKYKVKVFVPLFQGIETPNDIMAVFRMQCRFPVERWKIIVSNKQGDGYFCIFQIEKKTLDMLEKVHMRPRFKDRKIKFVRLE